MNSELFSAYSSVISCNFILLTRGFRNEGIRFNSLNRGLRVFLIGTSSLITFTTWNARLLIKTKYQLLNSCWWIIRLWLLNRCLGGPLSTHCLCSIARWRGQKKDPTWVRGQNIEDMMEKSGIKSGRGQIMRGAGGMWRARRRAGEQKSAAWRDRFQTYCHDLGESLIRKLKTAKIQIDDKWSMLLAQIKKCKQVLSK